MEKTLPIWTLYQSPKDYPGQYVARRFEVTPVGGPRLTDEVYANKDVAAVRDWVQQEGRRFGVVPVKLERDPSDDPVVLESWI
ncbi:hypothetical protein [Ferrimonas marina]|uniref:Uncharacterized protein n=1 Tax=Ferrimonas marina TaxID=299255 RepID=A0A1M5U8F5_9GAMM|nr:hypothetical protein [Ferrimonas marina]SHH59345.1 hypothetical protein SAMN02745129_2455 [Ferrimonas marina]